MQFNSLSDIINALILEIESQAGHPVRITGGSSQSCSTYFSVGGLAIRVSDHAAYSNISEVDYHIGLGSDHGDDVINVCPVYEQMICELDGDGEEISREFVECNEDDDDAEHVGYRVADGEIQRVAAALVAEATQ